MALQSRLPAPTRRVHLRRRMLAQLREPSPRYTRTVRADEGEWRAFGPGVSIKVLRSDADMDNMTAFIRMQPGACLEGHVHQQEEECLILEGEIFIGGHRLYPGDMHVAAAGTVHATITSPRGALMLVRAQIRPTL